MRHLLLALAVAACGRSAAPSAPPPSPLPAPPSRELSPALRPLDWWLGAWRGDHGDEHWVAADGAIYGIALGADGDFEVMVIDDADGPGKPDGTLRLYAMPGGRGSTTFEVTQLEPTGATFANPSHDFPSTIRYRLAGGGLVATIAGAGRSQDFTFRAASPAAAPELEQADRAFAAATGARAVEGWVAWFAPDGGMLRKGARIEGAAAITDAMKDLLASGTLAWAPIASGKRGGVGFTVGKATFVGTAPDDRWSSTYVTIWKQQPDGGWKVWFDTGRPVNEAAP